MRVVSWNIEFGELVDQAGHELTSLPDLSGADLVLLQEMDEPGTRTIAERLGVDFVFAAAASHPETGRDMGNAILSPWPIGTTTEIDLPHVARVSGQARSAVRAVVSIEGQAVDVYSVHTETVLLPFARRREQFATLVDDIAARATERVVVGGDFNTARVREVDTLTSLMGAADLHAVSQRSGATFRRFGRSFTLDHVFARGLMAHGSGVVTEATASDHLPVWVDLEL